LRVYSRHIHVVGNQLQLSLLYRISNVETNGGDTKRGDIGASAIILPGDLEALTSCNGCGSGGVGDKNGGVNRGSNDSEGEN
jgi:hypothetical protein